ncbi:hypothetical protein PFISCL1PPCAC_10752, partial [Pristionchus fissidentatus]
MFRKPGAKRAQAARQRKEPSSGEGSSDDGEVVKESLAKRRRKNPMMQSTKKDDGTKRARNSSSSSSEEERRDEFAFKASGESIPAGPKDMGATATLDIDTEKDRDARTQFERVQKELEMGEEGEPETDASGRPLYRGLARYGAKKAQDSSKGNAGSGTNRLGPVRAPQFLRQTVRWDFAPDICKDFKETGFCTFGDSCKFMHDRGDYKHGWELERDFEQGKAEAEQNYEISDDEDQFPDECPVCEQPFIDPVVTRCKHYFCEKCAITAFKRSKKCKVCEQNTGGVFNIAKELIAHLKGECSKKKKMKEEEEELEESDENDDEKVEDMKMEDAEGQEEREEEGKEREIKREEDEEEEEEEANEEEEEKEEEGAIKNEEEEGEGIETEIENEVEGEEEGGENVSDEDEYDEGEETEK